MRGSSWSTGTARGWWSDMNVVRLASDEHPDRVIELRVLNSWAERVRGLLATDADAAPVLLTRCGSIHTFGMRYPLDVAFVGALVGFLWYNAYPAQIFMGDTGSLAIGGIIAVTAIIIHKELLIPILCGIFLMENLSVVMQVSYFKYTRRKYGEGRRNFLMSPLHHHFQKKGIPEPKIVTRFWIIGIILAVVTIVTLKIR